jgi:hypothetical protein
MTKNLMKFFAGLFLLVLAGCGSGPKDKVCTNDFEDITAWCNVPPVVMGKGHSGYYFSHTDSAVPYTATFKRAIYELGDHPIRQAYISVWVRPMEEHAEAGVILSIERGEKFLLYNTIYTEDKATVKGEWVKIESNVAFPPDVQKDDILKFYVFNGSKKQFDADDFEIRFKY